MSSRKIDQEIDEDLREIDGSLLDPILRGYQLGAYRVKFLLHSQGIPMGQAGKILASYRAIADIEKITIRPGMISLRYL